MAEVDDDRTELARPPTMDVKHGGVRRRMFRDSFAKLPQEFRGVLHARHVRRVQEKRTQEWAEQAAAKGQPRVAHALRQGVAQAGIAGLGQEPVPGRDRVRVQIGPPSASPVIWVHRGQVCDGVPLRARSMTSVVIFSSTSSK